jgi:hypothetical protein
VERLRFKICSKSLAPDVELLPSEPPPQPELGLENGTPRAQTFSRSVHRFGASLRRCKRSDLVSTRPNERRFTHMSLSLGQPISTRNSSWSLKSPRKNSAEALLAALRDDWKPAVEIKKPRQQKQTTNGNLEQSKELSPEEKKQIANGLRGFRTSAA